MTLHKKTTKELAEILKKMNADKYKHIIDRAANNGYHDFKFDQIKGHPEYGDCICPKIQLMHDLLEHPELSEIVKDVIDGVYDEAADEEDKAMMKGWLSVDGEKGQRVTKIVGL